MSFPKFELVSEIRILISVSDLKMNREKTIQKRTRNPFLVMVVENVWSMEDSVDTIRMFSIKVLRS